MEIPDRIILRMGQSEPGGSPVNDSTAGTAAKAAHEARWREFVARCADRDHSALAVLYDESVSLVYRVALRVLGDPADAEEVSIDVYHQVWRTAPSYNGSRGSVAAWLVTLARSRAIDRVRSRAARTRSEEPIRPHIDARAATPGPEETSVASQRRARVQVALAALSPDQREAIELAFFSGFTHSELADRLGQPLGTVKTRIRSAMIRLREQLGEYSR